jgi:UDP-3-O-[3-hydroxymyristoyl] glucosamine N-acyltransferase
MTQRLYIFGTGAHARKVCHCAVAAGWVVAAFVDEATAVVSPVPGVPVLTTAQLPLPGAKEAMFIAIGRPDVRCRLMTAMAERGWQLPSLVHPLAWVAPDAAVSEGVLVAAGAVVESAVVVARGAIVDIGVLLDHECQVGEFAHLRAGTVCGPGSFVASPL